MRDMSFSFFGGAAAGDGLRAFDGSVLAKKSRKDMESSLELAARVEGAVEGEGVDGYDE